VGDGHHAQRFIVVGVFGVFAWHRAHRNNMSLYSANYLDVKKVPGLIFYFQKINLTPF